MFLRRGRMSPVFGVLSGVALSTRGRLSIIGFTLEPLERDYRK